MMIDETLRKLVAARYPLVWIETAEEQRLERILASVAEKTFSQALPLYCWTVTTGLVKHGTGEVRAETQRPQVALRAVQDEPKPGLYLFKGLHHFFDDREVERQLRDVFRALQSTYKTVFMCGIGTSSFSKELAQEVAVIDLPLPTFEELDQLLTDVAGSMKNLSLELGDQRTAFVRGAQGLSEIDARMAFTKLLVGKKSAGPALIEKLYEEKRQLVRREGILDYVPPKITIEQIGGLANLKQWLRQRQEFFSPKAAEYGLTPPKGVLFTGISGCGKSLAVQAVSTYWKMPLIRLDMNRIYAAVAGSPERTLERALQTAEAIAPCVLWIDEIETAIVGAKGEGAGPATRIFSSFLTWMQEKEKIVFVAATANEIDKLPPELLRKGRFDEVFFVDLPNEAERVDIFTVHLAKRNQDPKLFDLYSLTKSTPGFNGAEIEQVVVSALYQAFDEQRALEMKDLYKALGRMVPLSTTMSERIKEIKRWADTRAVKAS